MEYLYTIAMRSSGIPCASFSQERQTRGKPRRLVRRVPFSAIPVLATDNLRLDATSHAGLGDCSAVARSVWSWKP
jgi:hypothetical protein